MDIKTKNKIKEKIVPGFNILVLLFLVFFVYLMFDKSILLRPEKVVALVQPDTLKVMYRNSEFYFTSANVKTASGNEGCEKAIDMSKQGFETTQKLIGNANRIRIVPTGGKEDGLYINARIYINEERLGKILYQKNLGIKYTGSEKICS